MPKKKLTKAQNELIIQAIQLGAKDAQEIHFETDLDYMEIIAWTRDKENIKLMRRMNRKPLWYAKKKVMEQSEDPKDARWLLTHNKETKADWSDRVEHTGKEGKDLIPVTEEKKKQISEALDDI